jgi:hypothetical protein
MVNIVLCLGGSALQEDEDGEMISSLLGLFETLLSVVDAGIGFNSRETPDDAELDANSRLLVTLPADTLVDPISTQHSAPKAAAQNLFYLRLKGFYLDLAAAICQTKILTKAEKSPSFSLARVESEKNSRVQWMRNPDAVRLVLGLQQKRAKKHKDDPDRPRMASPFM